MSVLFPLAFLLTCTKMEQRKRDLARLCNVSPTGNVSFDGRRKRNHGREHEVTELIIEISIRRRRLRFISGGQCKWAAIMIMLGSDRVRPIMLK